MINQFLYGRTQNGFNELSDVSQAGYSQEDITGFQHLWVYELADGCDRNLKPESRSFFVSESAVGPTAQVGKTTFVPAGTSNESGNRDTTLLHKYLLAGEDFRSLMADPGRIFKITDFCATVEEAKDHLEAENPVFNENGSGTAGESVEELLKYFGIPAEKVPEFLYAVLDAAGNVDTRLYIALPEWNKNGTDMALKLCKRILECLPPFLVSSCGFLTYSKTYHNSQTNMIPRTVKIIFYPNNFENQRKYNTITEKNYVIDGKEGLLPNADTTPYTVDMVSAIAQNFLYGEKDDVWYPFFEQFSDMVPWDISVAPESVSCACKFMELKAQMDAGEPIGFDIEEIYYIVENYLDSREFLTPLTEAYSLVFLKKFVEVFPLDGDLLNILCDFYMHLPKSREFVITWICDKLVESVGDADLFHAVLKYSYESGQLIKDIHRRIYEDLTYYPAARYEEQLIHNEKAASAEQSGNWSIVVDVLYSQLEGLYEQWPDFLTDPDTVAMIEGWIDGHCMDQGEMTITIDELKILYERADKFAKENIGGEIMEIVLKFIRSLLSEQIINQLQPGELKLMKGWIGSLRENPELAEFEESFKLLGKRIEVMEYRELLESGNGDGCVERWKKDGEEFVTKMLGSLTYDKEKSYENLRFVNDDNFDEFYLTLFMTRMSEHKEICQEIMKNRGGQGGIIAMECLWKNIDAQKAFLWNDRVNMKNMIRDVMREHYLKYGVTPEDIKDIKSVMEFAVEMRVDTFANEGSVMDKLKNLTGGFPSFKKKEENMGPLIPGWKSKDADKKKW